MNGGTFGKIEDLKYGLIVCSFSTLLVMHVSIICLVQVSTMVTSVICLSVLLGKTQLELLLIFSRMFSSYLRNWFSSRISSPA
jgi:hypothetical protein